MDGLSGGAADTRGYNGVPQQPAFPALKKLPHQSRPSQGASAESGELTPDDHSPEQMPDASGETRASGGKGGSPSADGDGSESPAPATGASALDQVRVAAAAIEDGTAIAPTGSDSAAAAPAHAASGSGRAGEAPRKKTRPARTGAGRGKKKLARGPARRFARERALQALYQWDMASSESSDVQRQFVHLQDMSRVDVPYFERLFRGISHDVTKVDASLEAALDRPLAEVDPIERAVLRIAAFELAEVTETPARVIINEGVEITKRFGADNGHRYVNGVLDGLAVSLRPDEMRRG